MNHRNIFFTLLSLISTATWAQSLEGATYCLPQTAMRFTLLVEKTEYTPGEFSRYAQRYMKKSDVPLKPNTAYRIVNTKMHTFAVPDTTKQYTLSLDKRYSITDVNRTDNGILLAINTEGKRADHPQPFVPARKPIRPNPKDFMNEDILTAGSTAKMAELIAQEIYDIRDSRNQLQRGQAEFMPKDGQQLRIMMDGLDTQERALRQVFEGITEKDTTEITVDFIPTAAVERQLLFRFSRFYGLTDNDDMAGTPYYISIDAPDKDLSDEDGKGRNQKIKDDIGLNVNLPVKIGAKLFCENKLVGQYDFYAGQFGKTENMSGALFGKKQTTMIVLNPVTGGIESIREKKIED